MGYGATLLLREIGTEMGCGATRAAVLTERGYGPMRAAVLRGAMALPADARGGTVLSVLQTGCVAGEIKGKTHCCRTLCTGNVFDPADASAQANARSWSKTAPFCT
eukprot:1414428-Rhodomonas_salina.1